MVKVDMPNDSNTKFEIQKWLKKYSIAHTPFQSKDDLLFLVSENKKNVIDQERAAYKEKKLQEQAQKEKDALKAATAAAKSSYKSSSSSSNSSSSTSSATSTRSLVSPFKKIQIVNGKVLSASSISVAAFDDSSSVATTSSLTVPLKIINKPRNKLNLIDRIENNTLHVFISSTFKDMIGERDHLIKVVFPAINLRCKAKNLTIVPVDLRWGLTKEETTVKGQIELCLKQMDKCPIMISVVGERFGWIPNEYKLSSNDSADPVTQYLSSLPLGESITSIETRYGLSCHKTKHSVALFRDSSSLATTPQIQDHFGEKVEESKTKLVAFKEHIKSDAHCTVLDGYPCKYIGVDKQTQQHCVGNLQAFGDFVINQMMDIIELEFPNPIELLNAAQQEEKHHSLYQTNKAQYYWGREAFQKKLLDHIHNNKSVSLDKIAIVYGEPGCGKSSSLSNLVTKLEALNTPKTYLVLSHYVGCSGESTNVPNILERFSTKICKQLKINHEIPTNLEMLRTEFPKILQKASKLVKNIVIVIDDLDELSTQNQSHQMEWLPDTTDLPSNCFVLTSCDQNKTCWDYLHLRTKIPHTFYLSPLEMTDRSIITTHTLDRYSKRLEPKQLDRLVAKTHAKFPLYIQLVCEELRVIGNYDKLNSIIQKIPDTIDQLIVSILLRLEDDFGRDLIKKTLCFIALSRYGLLESELLDLLREKGTPLSFVQWAPLLIAISPLLRNGFNTSKSITFFHAQVAKVIIQKYLPTEKSVIVAHTQLADYYQNQCHGTVDGSSKKWNGTLLKPFVELPYHLTCAKRFDWLANLFQDLIFVETKFKLKLGRDLLENMLLAITETQSPTLSGERWTGLNFSSSNLVQDIYNFVQYQAHNIERYPLVVAQQAYNLPDDSVCHSVADRHLWQTKAPHFKWLNKPQLSDFVIASLAGHEDFVRCALYREDGNMIASCSDDRSIRIWSGETGALVRVFPKLHTDKITNLQWRGNNNLVTVSRDKRVVLWDEYGKVLHEFNGHSQAVWGVAVSGDGRRIASASWDMTCIVWDIASKQIAFTLTGHTNKLSAVAYSPDSRLIATGCWSGIVIIWDAVTGKQLQSTKVSDTTILYLMFSPDEMLLSASCVDSFTHILARRNNWSKEIAKLEGHKEAVISSRWSADGKFIVSCSDDKTVRVFDCADWSQASVMTGHSGRIISAAFHPNSSKRRIITAATDKFIKIWDPKLGYSVTQAHQGHRKGVSTLQYDHENDILYSLSDDHTIRSWTDFQRNDLLVPGNTYENINWKKFKLLDPQIFGSLSLAFAIVSNVGTVLQYCMDKKTMIKRLPDTVKCTAFTITDNDSLFAVADPEGVVYVYDVATFEEVYRNRHGFVVNELAFSPCSTYLAASDGKGTITILKSGGLADKTYHQCAYLTLEPMSAITSIKWSGDSSSSSSSSSEIDTRYMAVGTVDGSIHIFDVKRSFYVHRVTTNVHAFGIRSMAFSPSSKYLFTASLDKTAILWNVETMTIVSVFPLFSIATSNILFFKDIQNVPTVILSDYTGKIHHLKLIGVNE
ncbi:hypothetical protein DFA_05952 [Cavenderia fasciculata]|uniref:NACHT domain-containing protein n=1 Tax=Cavenderia fasciculata TaxID=261658 RepID=F4PJP2_CACFS|nr:uncharacterized protein DFA_05952 [Cavenderia fasciculata]EGG23816.1 hypothetical protein DFA_05952 [Cavenderia fasciculata]|eukprot:XP_004361667.1 hypothetical protein DFA_05952 [Cavenderia fasciculata]